MSFLGRLFGKKNRTATWERHLSRGLDVNFDTLSLCGVPVKAPFERLSFLGPDDDPYQRLSYHEYRDLGLDVWESDDGEKFRRMVIYVTEDGDYKRFRGQYHLRGGRVALLRDMTPQQLTALFEGWTATLQTDDEGQPVLSLELDFFELIFRWERGRLSYFTAD